MVDLVGWVATAIVLISMLHKSMFKLRVINAIACVLWIYYGTLIKNNPTIFVNSAILVAHVIWFIKNEKKDNIH
jgi:hypothetical protein